VPVDDENTLSVMWHFSRVPREREPFVQNSIPTWQGPIADPATGRWITSHVMNQDFVTWVGQGRIADRSREYLAPSDRGIVTTHLRSDGRHKAKLYVDGGPSSTQTVGHLRMEGREVFKHAVGMITDVIVDAFNATGATADDIDWFVPHQANKRIIDASAHKLHIAPQKVVLTVDLHGNTSAASIPLALAVAVKDGRVKKGDLLLFEAMGGGFTWGSALVRW
jgi:hypothetical protein